jgi:hypothetical protein
VRREASRGSSCISETFWPSQGLVVESNCGVRNATMPHGMPTRHTSRMASVLERVATQLHVTPSSQQPHNDRNRLSSLSTASSPLSRCRTKRAQKWDTKCLPRDGVCALVVCWATRSISPLETAHEATPLLLPRDHRHPWLHFRPLWAGCVETHTPLLQELDESEFAGGAARSCKALQHLPLWKPRFSTAASLSPDAQQESVRE